MLKNYATDCDVIQSTSNDNETVLLLHSYTLIIILNEMFK